MPTQITTPEEPTTARRAQIADPAPGRWSDDLTNIDPVRGSAGSPGARSLQTETVVTPKAVPATRPAAAVRRALAMGAAAVACIGLTLGGWVVFGAAPTPTTASPIPTVQPVAVPPVTAAGSVPSDVPAVVEPPITTVAPPSLAALRFEIVPPDARVSEGGLVVADGLALVPRDGAEHTFVVEARGRVTQRAHVTADGDQTIRVTLRRAGATAPTGDPGHDIAREF